MNKDETLDVVLSVKLCLDLSTRNQIYIEDWGSEKLAEGLNLKELQKLNRMDKKIYSNTNVLWLIGPKF